jgi:hypothetical protein
VIGENGAWYTKTSYDVVKNKKSCGTTIVQKGRHSLNPFCKVVDGDDYITVPPAEVGLDYMKSIPHLAKGLMAIMGCSVVGWVCALLLKTW